MSRSSWWRPQAPRRRQTRKYKSENSMELLRLQEIACYRCGRTRIGVIEPFTLRASNRVPPLGGRMDLGTRRVPKRPLSGISSGSKQLDLWKELDPRGTAMISDRVPTSSRYRRAVLAGAYSEPLLPRSPEEPTP